MDELEQLKRNAGVNEAYTPEDDLVEKVKQQIDPLFDSEDGREALEDLAEFIMSNLR